MVLASEPVRGRSRATELPCFLCLSIFVFNAVLYWQPTAVVTVPEAQLFWSVTPDVKATRLPRYTVPLEAQDEFESEKYES